MGGEWIEKPVPEGDDLMIAHPVHWWDKQPKDTFFAAAGQRASRIWGRSAHKNCNRPSNDVADHDAAGLWNPLDTNIRLRRAGVAKVFADICADACRGSKSLWLGDTGKWEWSVRSIAGFASAHSQWLFASRIARQPEAYYAALVRKEIPVAGCTDDYRFGNCIVGVEFAIVLRAARSIHELITAFDAAGEMIVNDIRIIDMVMT